ncbi:hypothetical protein GLE_5470 [Lysobacter enzymogenes]|uniref:Uncharacterized protein n=1 Tax=Lysobacter enzymogenes TaxID=69 RepID=A0A0S2DQ01_LYSEN|nr:hypothetical protein GLE_5470 [Lysobacter enzymogenes]
MSLHASPIAAQCRCAAEVAGAHETLGRFCISKMGSTQVRSSRATVPARPAAWSMKRTSVVSKRSGGYRYVKPAQSRISEE